MSVPRCARCGAEAVATISSIVDAAPHSLAFCEPCWRIARSEAGAVMSEGPILWGESWDEAIEWLTRSLRAADARPTPTAWRRLIAHDLQRQLPHLPAEVPQAVRDFLGEFGEAAG